MQAVLGCTDESNGSQMTEQFTVSEERFVDAGDRDAKGFYDYYYSGLILHVAADSIGYKVVCYDDQPGVASFKGTKLKGAGLTLAVDRKHPMFRAIVDYLASKYGIARVSLYVPKTGSFQTIEIANLFGGDSHA
jgi:hypothetical protein